MNKYKKLAFNTAVFAVGSFGSKILVILLTRLYTKNMSDEQMGIKDLLEMTALFLQPVFTFALQEYMIRFGLDEKYNKKEVFSTSALMTFTGMFAVFLTVPLLKFIPSLSFLKGYSLYLSVYVCMSSIRMLCAQFVRSRDMVRLFSIDGILTTLLLFVFNLIFIQKFQLGVKGFLLSVILSDTFSSLFLFTTARLGKFFRLKSFSPKVMRSMLRFAVPLIPTIVMWTVTNMSDRLFINNMHSQNPKIELGSGAVGLYAVANKIPNLISMVSTIFFSAWNMSAITENNSADRAKFYERIYSAYEAILVIASAGLMMLIKPVTSLLVDTSNYSQYGTVYIYTPVLIMAVVYMSLTQFLGSIYNATKHSQNSFWTCLAACLVNIVMNYFLIPVWGMHGAALATVLSYYICFWLRIVDARYYVPFRFYAGRSIMNTFLLSVMSWLIIAEVKLWQVWLVLLFAAVTAYNYKSLFSTIKKILKR